MKKTIITALLLSTLSFAGNQAFEDHKTKCINLLESSITCIKGTTNAKEAKICKDTMKIEMKKLKESKNKKG